VQRGNAGPEGFSIGHGKIVSSIIEPKNIKKPQTSNRCGQLLREKKAGTPSIRPTGLIQGMTFFATHHGSRYTSKTHFHDQTQMKRTSPFGPVTFYDILHAYRFDDQVGSRLLAPWNLTSQHSLILKRDRLHMHHMPTPYLSPKHPYAERANVCKRTVCCDDVYWVFFAWVG